MTVNLQNLLKNYTNNLCNKAFKYELQNKTQKCNDSVIIRFYKENLCHLLGLQHVFDNSKKHLGKSGYDLIKNNFLITSDLKKHNEKKYNYIKSKLSHFDEIYDILKTGQFIGFKQENCFPSTIITADFLLIKNNYTYILHLFLRKELNSKKHYSPISFIVHTNKDKHFYQYINNQTYKEIIKFEEIIINSKEEQSQ